MKEIHNAPCPELADMIASDDLIYTVLRRVLRTPCRHIVTDESHYILCHSSYPYPVWLWTAEGMNEHEKDMLWGYGKEELEAWDEEEAGGTAFRLNTDYPHAEAIMLRARDSGVDLQIVNNLHVYDCKEIIPYDKEVDGAARLCTADDAAHALLMMRQFFAESVMDKLSEEEFRQKTEVYIYARRLFFWENEAGVPVAMCAYIDNGDGTESLNNVITMPAHRRKGYAARLTAHVTKEILDKGHVPMLYTDADYAPSNACYEKIGFVRRGSLCTIGAGKE